MLQEVKLGQFQQYDDAYVQHYHFDGVYKGKLPCEECQVR